jgi:hypothetical protein
MTDIKTVTFASTAAAGAGSTGGITQALKHATLLFTCIMNALIPYLPAELHPYVADILHFNERFPILIVLPIVVAIGYVVASVSGVERAFAEIGKAMMIVLFTVGPVIALSERLSLIGACIATLATYAVLSFLIERISRPSEQPKVSETVSFRR